MNGNLTKYEVNHSQLTLTIQIPTGEEIVVLVSSDVAEALGNDIFVVMYCGGGDELPLIAKVTRTIAPDGSIQGDDDALVEYEKYEEEE